MTQLEVAVGAHEHRRRDMLRVMGIDVWEPRTPHARLAPAPAGQSACLPDLAALRAGVAACTACELHRSRTQTVFGVGDPDATLMVVGEAPGADEDRLGEPFVGRAGQLLNSMLRAIGFSRESVYIANILKCRPPKNRDPLPAEVAACQGFLQRQIDVVKPRVLLAVGRVAAQNLLGVATPIGKMRGQTFHYGASEIPVVVTYHPAYLLRSPGEKRKTWTDLCIARHLCTERDGQ